MSANGFVTTKAQRGFVLNPGRPYRVTPNGPSGRLITVSVDSGFEVGDLAYQVRLEDGSLLLTKADPGSAKPRKVHKARK